MKTWEAKGCYLYGPEGNAYRTFDDLLPEERERMAALLTFCDGWDIETVKEALKVYLDISAQNAGGGRYK